MPRPMGDRQPHPWRSSALIVVKQVCSPHNPGLGSIDAYICHGLTAIIAAVCECVG